MAKTTIAVTFAAAAADAPLLKLVLDSETSGSLVHNQTAYLRMYKNPMTLEPLPSISHGSLSRQGLRREQITETVAFANTDTAGLSAPASQLFSWQWIGRDLGDLRLSAPETVACGVAGCGAARVTYETVYESLAVLVPRGLPGLTETDVVVCATAVDPATNEEIVATLALGFGDASGTDDPDDPDDPETVVIRVVDYTTGDPVPGARVTVDGVARGRTSADGRVSVGVLASGAHTLGIAASGYHDTGVDELHNETFTL
ncbi:carboxypeptidase regulatory-like domain-containing protein [Desulfovibrio sulfodismutans]|uniref:Carboxypeptidase regulatory-like domain-containing protein n=1 Tax=Desulfolutivibrio sulfodismutans TaxID=63561 RepID=A0A7K3NJG9_9BACT|nr:carboxypeptidase-like regulatory domain-containing protein [Desulfolutivibrio sulfodismutans]NDY56342.1 carboxypeptidase regulatory-like domain-containing protein [Desulfolutivibrio sulfodismutans]QLA11530.1 hypothetical protein GD606_04180 [Desulfolutivibrio sulfodismutans DSM 3696]QLA14173.1 hypothetical protein GD606_18830 [Desulfolutivibrio sulfodismutans DSM 3696]